MRGAALAANTRRATQVAKLLRRIWLVVVIAVVGAAATFAIHRLRGVFGIHNNISDRVAVSDDMKPFNPKKIAYEIFGAIGTVASISFLDLNEQPRFVSETTTPWSLEDITTLPSVSLSIVAQGNTNEIGCRILVNGEVRAERVVNEVNAQTFCVVKSA
nr:MmpS family transport accessory protein [Mycobacterium gordonae]